MVVQPCLCGTWSETPKTCFLATRLILCVASLDAERLHSDKLPFRARLGSCYTNLSPPVDNYRSFQGSSSVMVLCYLLLMSVSDVRGVWWLSGRVSDSGARGWGGLKPTPAVLCPLLPESTGNNQEAVALS